MTPSLFTDLLLPAMVIGFGPIPIIAITLILGTPLARPNGVAYAAGWLLGLTAMTALSVFLADEAEKEVADANTRLRAIEVMLLLKDTNAPGTIFGSVIASHIDLAPAVWARMAAPHRFVTMTDGKSDAGMEGAEGPIAR